MDATQTALWVVILLVVIALLFDFMNGFHDAANSIATVVSTGVLRPTQAVRDRGKELDVPLLLNRRELLDWLSMHVVDDGSDSEVGAELEGSRAVKGVGSRKKKKQPVDRKKATKKKATKKKPAKKKATKRKVRR